MVSNKRAFAHNVVLEIAGLMPEERWGSYKDMVS